MRGAAVLITSLLGILAAPATAQVQMVSTTVTIEEWVEEGADRPVPGFSFAAVGGVPYGPFRVLDSSRAALVGVTDGATPAQFQAMLRAHPGIVVIEMIECPGTEEDIANLRLGRMIRAAGIATYVPANGSVRSGAVELFLAGVIRQIEDGAEFAVHAWRDSDGRGPHDFDAQSAVNRAYLDYYREMGVGRPEAFYAMTNAAPNAEARWLEADAMRQWLNASPTATPRIAYLDLSMSFP